ncbi:RDD family protein [filamentous cyanobacterium LEGE 11480]|uniref:RDD family protein n=1 Tax=Romeriopsis navalis LEGE 11480 TaxID=2777977 RepID=A0A928VNH9_9CYAN|nr:RDD family protein [Romeriopsis navalis]MBE9031776.1 RDD family protein [Romeriopsis navalis LEGE 11480]
MNLLNRITLKTPESVELEFQLAGIGNRTMALFIDNLVIWSIYTVLAFLTSQALLGLEELGFSPSLNLFQWLGAIAVLLTFAWFVGYFAVFEMLWQGQTPGKRYAKIRVIGNDGRPLQIYQATLRALIRPLDDWLFLGFFLVLFGRQERRLGDMVASTIVIQDEQPNVGSAQLPLSGRAQAIADQVQLNADMSQLLPDDFAILREFLQRRQAMAEPARERLSQQLAEQVKRRLDIEALEFVEPAEVFLEGAYLAYEQQRDDRG